MRVPLTLSANKNSRAARPAVPVKTRRKPGALARVETAVKDAFTGLAAQAKDVVVTAENLLRPDGPPDLLPPRDIGLGTTAEQLDAQLDQHTHSRATAGNHVQVYIDGQNALPHVLAGIDAAKVSICYETYELDGSGETVDQIIAHLIAAKQRGVDVRVSADAAGAREIFFHKNPELQKLRAAGVDVKLYNTFRSLQQLDVHRDHRKAILIDGHTAFMGGMNTGDRYFGGTQVPNRKHDVFAQIQGPAVQDLLKDFLSTWRADGGEIDPASLTGPKPQPLGGAPARLRVMQHTPGKDANIRAAYLALINHATTNINLENSYPPSQNVVDALCAAAKRGVKVHYIVGSNEGWLGADARKSFGQLLAAGVRLFVYPTPIHTKSMSVDGQYAMVGSSNVDNVSLTRNQELMTLAEDPAYTQAYDKMLFDRDVVGTADGKKSLELHAPLHDGLWQRVGDAVLAELWPDSLE